MLNIVDIENIIMQRDCYDMTRSKQCDGHPLYGCALCLTLDIINICFSMIYTYERGL